MALTVSGFTGKSLDYKAFHDTDVPNTMVGNVTGTSGTLYHLFMDNTAAGTAAYYYIYFDADVTVASYPDIKIYVAGSTYEVLEIPGGVSFTQLSYYVTTDVQPDGAPAATGTVQKLYGVTS